MNRALRRLLLEQPVAAYLMLALAFVIGMWRLEQESNARVEALRRERVAVAFHICEAGNRRVGDLSNRIVNVVGRLLPPQAEARDYAIDELTVEPEDCAALATNRGTGAVPATTTTTRSTP